jgi:hypothetical protein
MSTSFYISIDSVNQLAGSIGRTAEELSGSTTMGDSPTILSWSDPSAGKLHGQISSFFHDWSDGMTRISGHLRDIDTALQKAVGAYSTTEGEIVAAATPNA